VEQALRGADPSEDTVRRTITDQALEIEPDGDIHASAEYRGVLTRVLARRAVVRAAARASGGAGARP
jgi:CO/xanthine dehydrogenase FAD-binding subunit